MPALPITAIAARTTTVKITGDFTLFDVRFCLGLLNTHGLCRVSKIEWPILQLVSLAGVGQETEWAAYAVKRGKSSQDDNRRAIEDKCLRCFNFWTDRLKKITTWEDLVSKVKNPKEPVSREIVDGLAVYDQTKSFEGDPSDIFTNTETGLEVASEGFFLNREEFIQFMKTEEHPNGLTPEQCNIKESTGLNADGSQAKGFKVKDESRPWRTFRQFARSADFTRTWRLDADQQTMPCEPALFLQHLHSKRQSGEGGPKLTIKASVFSKTELLKRAAQLAVTGDVPAQDGFNSGDDGSDGEEVVRAGKLEAKAAEGSEAKRRRCSTACSSAASAIASLVSPAKSIAKSLSSDKMGEDDDEEADGRTKSWAHWVSVLNPQKIMNGTKLGKQKGFAQRAIERMTKKGDLPIRLSLYVAIAYAAI